MRGPRWWLLSLFGSFALGLGACDKSSPSSPTDSRPVSDAAAPEDGTRDQLVVPDVLPPPFTPGHVFVAGSRNAQVFEYDPTFKLITSWTHPHFGQMLPPPGQDLSLGPQGMAFDRRGRLVVAAHGHFCVFTGPGADKVEQCYPKIKLQPTENIIFDIEGNLYTTTSTGGTEEVHKYDWQYNWVKTFFMPKGQLTGITCDPDGNLFVASQDSPQCHVYKIDKKTLAPLDTIDLPCGVEGLQYTKDGHILVGDFGHNQGLRLINSASPYALVRSISDPGLYGPVPVTLDNQGRIYTADYENGDGSKLADLFLFDVQGHKLASLEPSTIYGPFGMVVAGVQLPCGAYQID